LAVGFAAWLTIDVLKGAAATLIPRDVQLLIVYQVATTVLLPALILMLAVGAVGVGVWRGAFAALVRGEHATRGTGRLGAAMGAGSLLPASLNILRAGIGETGSPFAASLRLALWGALVALPFSIGAAWIKAALPGRGGSTASDRARPPISSRASASSWLGRCFVAVLSVAVVFGMAMKLRNSIVAEQRRHELIAAAESADGGVQTRLAMMYLSGQSVAQDNTQAAFWMLKAAESGDAEGMYRLGVMYFNGWAVPQDASLAAHWLLKSAEKGNGNAIRDLGIVFIAGRVPQDGSAILNLLRSAAEKGNADAQNSLGLASRFGRGTTQDDGTPRGRSE